MFYFGFVLCVPLLLLAALGGEGHPVNTAPAASSLIMKKVQSRVLIREILNLTQIEQHLHLWISELGHSVDKTDRLLAATVMKEYHILKAALLHTLPSDYIQRNNWIVPEKEIYPGNNAVLRRNKRNIIGDFLNYVGGVATEDQLKKQIIIDKEIREKITNTLTRQLSFEHTISAVYTNLTQEEDALHRKLDDLTKQVTRNKALTSKMAALLHVATMDLQDMEDCLEVLWQRQANPRQATRLATKAGITTVPHLRLHNHTAAEGVGVIFLFETYIYKDVLVQLQQEEGYLVAAIADHSLYLHPGHHPQLPLTPRDTVARNIVCTRCAIPVHIDHNMYKIAKEGQLTCSDGNATREYAVGDWLNVGEGVRCWNDLALIDPAPVALVEYNINLAVTDVELDTLLLKKEMASGVATVEQPHHRLVGHRLSQLKLQRELQAAQQDLNTFIATTRTDMTQVIGDSGHYVTWTILAVTTPLLLAIVLGILWSCKRRSGVPS